MTGLAAPLLLLAASVWAAGAIYFTVTVRPSNVVAWATCLFWPIMATAAFVVLLIASFIKDGDMDDGEEG